ncbi:aminoglycoside phosphotransferase (APT) family kinase protein [Microbacterium trichothecenolyticum]|uniref:phosphotransferase family protein n=1 Tax=Microbacterium trichothecenolyticum TaxID=69370 RepID=UPI00285BE656|nr:phosphotransferase [Microbacterium trichothecenolyticum]MDR7187170.1 aminoglycoside phosphotransferase (APT) family kinase protein [Microbacterium trichothecenolyticum]
MNIPPHQAETEMLAAVGARHQLWPADVDPIILARGSENTTFTIDGWIVRHSIHAQVQAQEVALLSALAESVAVPVPTPVFHEPELGLFAYRRLPGTPLLHTNVRHTRSVERGLVEVLGALRTLDAARHLPLDAYPNKDWHQDAIRHFQDVRDYLSDSQVQLVEAFIDQEPPPARAATIPQHNDLGAEHILVDARGHLTGIIDWTDAARTDPARDTGSIYRDLGGRSAFRISEALGRPITDDEAMRIRFHARCRWIEDVTFGLERPGTRHAYLANARRTFEHTFGNTR